MNDNYNYPLGADNERAPWNEKRREPKEFLCNVSVTIEKKMYVPTDNYDSFVESDDMGKHVCIETDNVDWTDEYKQNCIGVDELMNELEAFVRIKIKELEKKGNGKKGRMNYLHRVLDDCLGWKVTDIYVEQH